MVNAAFALITEARAVHAGHGDPDRLVNLFHDSTLLIQEDHIAAQLTKSGRSWIHSWSTLDHLVEQCGPTKFYTARGADLVNHVMPTLLEMFPERIFNGLYIDAGTAHWIALPIRRLTAIAGQDVTPIRPHHPGKE
ncbi:hypothetical protein [Kutzneria buriramensis]|uniref:Uncharacterized protein n=1 Tax=Kutzneria buriramensis TaxID=1045776 RepID=A0A3E0I9A0_9PSEU|nr:hypothetical protein [Kutzneria buriramensis]REH55240.1 hypothetical protein BCF44_101257 [Kutzneria buriramensis]